MTNEKLIIKKKGKLFPTQNIIPIFEIEKIEIKDYPKTFYNLFFRLLGKKGGNINIEYLGKNIYVGEGLTNNETYELVSNMNNLLSTYRKSLKNNC